MEPNRCFHYVGQSEVKPLEQLEITTLALQGGREAIGELLLEAHADYQASPSSPPT